MHVIDTAKAIRRSTRAAILRGLVTGRGCVLQELYGNAVAGTVLSAFSRLFTFYLQVKGFTCGIDDVLLVGHAERARAARIADAETVVRLGLCSPCSSGSMHFL